VEKMTLTIYNSLSSQKEEFISVEKDKVKLYVCGMTVYSDAHIGHARTYYAFDVIRRYLEYKGYKVTYVQNITDVDDKIISAANKEKIDALDYSRRFADRCLKDLDKLGIRRADLYPKASETIQDMIEMCKTLIEKGYAYESEGDVYFSVEKFNNYGKLSGQKIDEMKATSCTLTGENKHNHFDFALWKKAKPDEPFWKSPWGKGRPGWHIECSAMSSKFLGLPFDIHGGGMDLRFPHHENEIAQAEAATGKKFAKYWMHIGLLTINGEKMSKSLGNIININDLLKNWDSEVIRLFFAQTHYRSPPDFNERAIKNAEKGLERIHRLKEKFEYILEGSSDIIDESQLSDNERIYYNIIKDFKNSFEKSMDDDFNTPEAIALIFNFVNKSNSFLENNPNPNFGLCSYSLNTLIQLGGVLSLFQPKLSFDNVKEDSQIIKLQDILFKYGGKDKIKNVEDLMNRILEIRQNARIRKDWKVSDDIRQELKNIGFEVQDTVSGSSWRKK
jgi:cysteinyl-tRNA synthetase